MRPPAGALRPLALALATAAGLAAGPQEAGADVLWRQGDASIELSGSARGFFIATKATDLDRFQEEVAESLPSPVCVRAERFADCPAFDTVGERDAWQGLLRLRTRLEARASRSLSATIAYDHELRTGILDTLEGEIGSEVASDRFLDLERDIHVLGLRDGDEHVRWRHLLYRAYVRFEREALEVSAGRQRIAWGVGRLWNPIDRLNPIGPLAIEADESLGVDALDVRYHLSGFRYFEAVVAPGDRSRDADFALRFHGVVRNADVSLLAGVFDQARTLGADLARNLGGAAVRFELVYTDPERDVWPIGASAPREPEPFWQAVASIDTTLDWGSGLYVLAEHLYNGNALGFGRGRAGPLLPFFESSDEPPAPALAALDGPFATPASPAILGGSQVVTGARHQTGFAAAYDLTPALSGEILLIADWNGESAAVLPTLRYTGFQAFDVLFGVQLFPGPHHSEYGRLAPLPFFLLDYFF